MDSDGRKKTVPGLVVGQIVVVHYLAGRSSRKGYCSTLPGW